MYVSKKLLNPTSSKRRFDSYPMPGSRFRARHLFVFCLVTCCVRRAGVACEGSRERNPPRRPLRQSKVKHNRAGDKKKKEKRSSLVGREWQWAPGCEAGRRGPKKKPPNIIFTPDQLKTPKAFRFSPQPSLSLGTTAHTVVCVHARAPTTHDKRRRSKTHEQPWPPRINSRSRSPFCKRRTPMASPCTTSSPRLSVRVAKS